MNSNCFAIFFSSILVMSVQISNFNIQVQFWSDDGNLVRYEESDVTVSGNVGDTGILRNLSNGKTKVNSEISPLPLEVM